MPMSTCIPPRDFRFRIRPDNRATIAARDRRPAARRSTLRRRPHADDRPEIPGLPPRPAPASDTHDTLRPRRPPPSAIVRARTGIPLTPLHALSGLAGISWLGILARRRVMRKLVEILHELTTQRAHFRARQRK